MEDDFKTSDTKYCFSDGVGLISVKLAKKVLFVLNTVLVYMKTFALK